MTSIFVAKLDFGVSQEELQALFEQYGRVNKVTIATDRETKKPRGFAFVEMFDEKEADNAIQNLDNSSINGRQIAVKKAEERGGGDSKPFVKRSPAGETREARPAFNRPENTERFSAPAVDPESLKSEQRKKEAPKKKEKTVAFNDGKPRQQKMPAYKKSGKNNRFTDFDEDDDY